MKNLNFFGILRKPLQIDAFPTWNFRCICVLSIRQGKVGTQLRPENSSKRGPTRARFIGEQRRIRRNAMRCISDCMNFLPDHRRPPINSDRLLACATDKGTKTRKGGGAVRSGSRSRPIFFSLGRRTTQNNTVQKKKSETHVHGANPQIPPTVNGLSPAPRALPPP